MGDLATLGLRIESQEVATAEKRMDDMAGASSRAERATDSLGAGAGRANSAIASMLASINRTVSEMLELQRAQQGVVAATSTADAATENLTAATTAAYATNIRYSHSLDLVQAGLRDAAAAAGQFAASADRAEAQAASTFATFNTFYDKNRFNFATAYNDSMRGVVDTTTKAGKAMGLTATEGLNLSRQFADIGVQAAMGMSPLMILIQQGPQIADVFQTARMRGVGFSDALAGIGRQVAPLLRLLGPLAALAGVATAGFALFHRELSQGYPDDVTRGLGLTEEQLKRVEDSTVTFGDTWAATWAVAGRHIMDSPIGEGLQWLIQVTNQTLDFIGQLWADGWAWQIGLATGAYKAVTQTWKQFPAMIGELVIEGVNLTLQGVELLVNGTIQGFNALAVMLNQTFGLQLAELGHVDLPELENKFSGATASIGKSFRDNILGEVDSVKAGMRGIMKEIGDEALARAVKRALDQAGDPNKRVGRGGMSDTEKAIRDTMNYIKALKDQAATYGMNAIAAKEFEIQQRALAALTPELRAEVEKYGAVLVDKMKAEVASTKEMENQIALLQLERQLIGASNTERSVRLAQLAEEQRLIGGGVDRGDARFGPAVNAAGRVAAERELLNQAVAQQNAALEYQLDLYRQIDDHARSAASGMADAFGEQGRALGDLLASMTGYRAQIEEIALQRDRWEKEGLLTTERAAMLERDRAQAQIASYGDMAVAARGFFEEGSDGYKILTALERAYRLQQFAMTLQAMVLGGQETAASIASSGAKGAASMAAGAAKMFETLGPLGFGAVAAMVGVLAGFGLSGGGGGGGGRSRSGRSVADAQTFSAQAVQATSSAAADRNKLEVVVTTDKDGLTAYVRDQAAVVAAPMSVSATRVGAAGGAATALTSMPAVQRRNYRLG